MAARGTGRSQAGGSLDGVQQGLLENMKYCTRCGNGFGLEFDRCPTDGEVLQEPTSPLDTELCEVPQGTGDLALEIEDIIFRICSSCHDSFGGLLDICPKDGCRLSEPSMITRHALLRDGGAGVEPGTRLRKYCTSCNKQFALHWKNCPECGSALTVPTLRGPWECGVSSAREGQVIADKYRVIHDIGAGGFGSVYLAKHESLGKCYAIKMLRAQLSNRPSFRSRFHEEALKLSRLEDENIVKVIDFGEWQNCQYMVTEFVEGQDLGDIIYGEKATPLRAARIMKQVAGALGEAHAKQIVHLDLKPSNILVSQKRGHDLVKVIDFGIAEIYSEDEESRQDRVCGTFTYMAPEQWRRQSLDPRTDMYSFGAIFYEFLAGRPPFRESTVKALEKAHLSKPPRPLRDLRPDVPVDIEKLIHRCLEKDPTRRVQTARDLEAELGSYLRRTENARAVRLRRLALAATIVIILAATGWAFREARRDREDPTWVSCVATGEGNALHESEVRPGGGRKYQTREKSIDVTLSLDARDNEGIERIKIGTPDGLKEELPANARSPDGTWSHHFTLTPEMQTLQVEALDPSGNSATTTLTFEFLRASIKTSPETLPTATHQPLHELKIEVTGGEKTHLSCRRGEQSLREADVLKNDVEPFTVKVRLQPGSNVIEVGLRDVRTGRPAAEVKTMVVDYLESPLAVTAHITAVPGKVLALESPGAWLSGQSDIQLVVEVEDAVRRLDPAGALSYILKSGDVPLREKREKEGRENGRPRTATWDPGDLVEGRITIRIPVEITPGRNDITILRLTDRYGNRSEELPLVVYFDDEKPRVSIINETLTYYEHELPTLHFKVEDGDDQQAVEASNLELWKATRTGDKLVDRDHFRFSERPGGWDLDFLDAVPLQADGTHEFRLGARDRVGNKTLKDFRVLVDHTRPAITILGPHANWAFRRNDPIHLEVEIDGEPSGDWIIDGEPSGDSVVEAVVFVNDAGSKGTSPFPPFPLKAVEGIWKRTLTIEREVEKPKVFTTLEPKFTVAIRARDPAGHESTSELTSELTLPFGWENGDRLEWQRTDSVLIYHEACRARDIGAFWLESTEVTNGQYERFLEAERERLPVSAPRSEEDWPGGRCSPEKRDFPVRGVSWIEVEAYARWAGLQPAGRSQWLHAAFWNDAETPERRYPWGKVWPPRGLVPYAKRKNSPVRADDADGGLGGGKTPHGLLHMLGNVWELVLDEAEGLPVPVGGGFDTPDAVLRGEEDAFKRYVRGEYPDGPTIGRGDYSRDLGFRCMLPATP